jgi:hypothetical protein
MVQLRAGAFPALLTSAAFIGHHSNSKNTKIEWDKKKAFNSVALLPESLQTQKRTQLFDTDEFDFIALNPIKTAENADLLFLKPRKKANSLKVKTLKSIKPEPPAGPVCNVVVPIDQKPHPDCGLTPDDATLLAKSAIEGQNFPSRALLMGKIKTPWDILTADRVIAKVLDEANVDVTPEQAKANSMRALFLRDNIGQCVINQAMQTWHGKRVMAAYVIKVLPSEMNPRIPAVRSLAGDGTLDRQEARLLADQFILKQSLKKGHEKLEQVIGFKDLVVLEEAAIEALAEASQNAKSPKDRAELAMNLLFMLHAVGTQTANRIMTEQADRVAYMKHMIKSLTGVS